MTMGAVGRRAMLVSLVDLAWSALVVAPLVVLFWRGTWDILTLWVYPESPALDAPGRTSRLEKSGLVCFLVGLVLRILLDLIKPFLGEILAKQAAFVKIVGRLMFTFTYAFAGICFWRGTWYLMRLDVGEKSLQLLVVLVGGVSVFVFSKMSRTLVSTPLALCQDSNDKTFEISSYFRKNPDNKAWFLGDVVFTNVVVRLLVVFCWWSLWSLESHFLTLNMIGVRDDKVAYDSLLLGYAATIIVFLIDKWVARMSITKLYINKVMLIVLGLLGFFASVNVWRGLWSVYDNYLFPHVDKEINYLTSCLGGFVLLALARVSNTISMDHILFEEPDQGIVQIEYWKQDRTSNQDDEMIPIVE